MSERLGREGAGSALCNFPRAQEDGRPLRLTQSSCPASGVARAWTQAYFGEGSGPVLLDEVRCTGNELAIEECPKRPWGEHNCGHGEDAGVSCTPLTGRPPRPRQLRPTPRGLLSALSQCRSCY